MKRKLTSSKIVKCPKCYRKLCMRVPVHMDKEEVYVVQIIHRKMGILAFDTTITCPICSSVVRVTGSDGIIEKELNQYA